MVAYRRWYDPDPKLNAVVQALEELSEANQRQISRKLLEVSQELLARAGGEEYLANLDAKKKDGLRKSKSKKRWYDRQEQLYKAFYNIYALDAHSRRDVAEQMGLPIHIVHGYERHCRDTQKTPELSVVEEILRTCFQEGQNRAKKLYALYLPEFNAAFQSHQKSHLKQEPSKGIWTLLLESIREAIRPA